MIKTKLTQQNINKLNKFEEKLQQLTKIEENMYERILKNQQHTLNKLQEAKESRERCTKERPMNMKAQTFEEIVKHPVNDNKECGNGAVWMYLANFIQERHDLTEVEKRMIERQKIRENIDRVKEEERVKEEDRLRKEKEDREYEERIKNGKVFYDTIEKNKNKNSKKKVPFNLQRQLHLKEVEENRKRIERMEEYKRQTYYENQYL